MIVEIHIPSPGESITEVEMASWFVESGDFVEKDQEIGEIESDKATLPLIASESGEIEIVLKSGETAKVGDVACKINTESKDSKRKSKESKSKSIEQEQGQSKDSKSKSIEQEQGQSKESKSKSIEQENQEEMTGSKSKESKSKSREQEKGKSESGSESEESKSKSIEQEQGQSKESKSGEQYDKVKISPVAKKMMDEKNLSIEDILNGLKRIGKNEVAAVISQGNIPKTEQKEFSRETERAKMSQLRKKISHRLVSVKNETAMLTTFNEADMSKIIEMRSAYQNEFTKKHGIKLGFMSFFAKAAAIALKVYPKVGSMIEGEEIVTPGYADIGIAVQTDKGLMVPVIRNVESLTLAEIEHQIAEIAQRARKGRISIDEMSGGSFTITNGGVFGSLLSTPILNPPQSAILGMHNIIERPIAENGSVVIKPMMYLAVSYDHRVIDGKDSVTFLIKIKELIENPQLMMFNGENITNQLLGI